MTRVRSTHQIEGLISLDNQKCIAIFTDFDSAVLFRVHHPAWEVHIHFVLARAVAPVERCTASAYLTDGETVYKQAIYTAEELGLTPKPSSLEPSPKYHIVEEAILHNPHPTPIYSYKGEPLGE